MKYKAIIETEEFKNFEFFEDGNGKYLAARDAGAKSNEWIALYFTECQQESIIDKIRAEIEEYWKYCDDNVQAPTLRGVYQIIDKYKEESEIRK